MMMLIRNTQTKEFSAFSLFIPASSPQCLSLLLLSSSNRGNPTICHAFTVISTENHVVSFAQNLAKIATHKF